MKKYLVTGAAGFVGRSIAEALLARGESVRGVDNISTGRRENLYGLEAMEFIEGDLNAPDIAIAACSGVDVIFHEAALSSVVRSLEDPVTANEINVSATVQLLSIAREAGVRRVVYASSSAVYGNGITIPKHEKMTPNPISPYAVSKLACEYYLKSFTTVYGLETVVLRYFNIFGPYQDPASQYSGVLAQFSQKMLADVVPTIHGTGEQSRDFVYIQDIVRANLLAAFAPAKKVSGKVFNIATGSRITLNEIVIILREITGYRGEVSYGPERIGDVRHSLADISRARKHLGYEPRIAFREGLQRTVEWCRSAYPLLKNSA